VYQKSVFAIGIRVAGSNPETRKPPGCFTLRVRDDENRPNISAGMRERGFFSLLPGIPRSERGRPRFY
jgi:hypothetical protein